MAHTKSAGAAKNLRDSKPKYLGVKKFGGEKVKPGDIIVRQRGSKFIAGEGVSYGKDYTIYALRQGIVKFKTKYKNKFNGIRRVAKVVSVH